MVRARLHVAALALSLALGACVSTTSQPKLKVLSLEQVARPARDMVLFVEVTNPAARPLRLERLQYSFASSTRVAGVAPVTGEVMLSRTVDAGAAVVVEVPLAIDPTVPPGEEMTLAGKLYATQDQLQREFAVSAKLDAP